MLSYIIRQSGRSDLPMQNLARSSNSKFRRYGLVPCLAAVLLIPFVTLTGIGPQQRTDDQQNFYLIAGTPIDSGAVNGYPATLYSPQAGKLKELRQLVPGSEGVSSVNAWGGSIFPTHPLYHGAARAVSIIHAEEPLRVDDVVFNPEAFSVQNSAGLFVLGPLIQLSVPGSSGVDEILPVGRDQLLGTMFLAVSTDSNAKVRVKDNAWTEYSSLRREGDAGGPQRAGIFNMSLSGNTLVFPPAFGHAIVFDQLPPSVAAVAQTTITHSFLIIAASPEYLLLRCNHVGQEFTSGKVGNSVDMFVHDRVHLRWKTIQIEGNLSRSRLFGSWVATVVEMFSAEQKPRPGAENERETATDRLPSVRQLYAYGHANGWLPGVLVLQNLEDDRKIRIETGQEDSEILSVRGDQVLYRVNDTIYQAVIVGDKLQPASVVVKDDDVPEVHWVFWSN